jgi:hypothetical protein
MKRFLWIAALSFAAACGLGAWYATHQAAASRAARWGLQREETAAEALLERPVTFDGREISLEELRELVAAETGLDITIDSQTIWPMPEELPGLAGFQLETVNWPPPDPKEVAVRLPIGTLPLHQGLAHALAPLKLACEPRGSSLVITTAEEAASHLRTVVYPLPQPTLGKTDEHDWAELVMETIDPGTWHDAGETGRVEAVPGALTVVQTTAAHRQVRQLIAELARLEFGADSLEPRVIHRTFPTQAESELVTVAYPVDDLVSANDEPDFDPLLELISNHVSPPVWSGFGTMTGFGDRWLVVTQRKDVHEQLEWFLAQLRRGIAEGGKPLVLGGPNLSPAQQRIREALAQPIDLDYDKVPLNEVCTRLSSELGFDVVLDVEGLRRGAFRINPPITWHMSAIPLKSQLFWMLRELDLAWMVHGDALVITATEDAQSQLLTIIYDARSLSDPDIGLAADSPLVENLVRRLVTPDSWDEVGGPGSLSEFQGLLIVTQTPKVHAELEPFLTALAAHCRPGAAADAREQQVVRVSPSSSGNRIETALAQPISADYCGLPLEEVLRDLARRLDLPVVFDTPAVVAEGYDFREPVSLSVRDRPLGSVLDELFARREFTYDVRDDVLYFRFKSRPDSRLETRLYRIDDLVQPGDLAAVRLLIDRLGAEDPPYWQYGNTGPGLILPMGDDWLAASAESRKHEEIADALDEIRTGQTPLRAAERLELQRVMTIFQRLQDASQRDPFAP